MPLPAKKSTTTTTKSVAKPAEAKSDTPAKPAPAKAAAVKPALSPAERMKMIAEAAYYLAQKRGFTGGNELTDWVTAEKQVDAQLNKRG